MSYLESVLAEQRLDSARGVSGAGTGDEKHDRLLYGPIGSAVRERFREIASIVSGLEWRSLVLSAGSFAKGTAIAAAFDLDLVVYFPREWTAGPREIYEAVEGRLRAAAIYAGVACGRRAGTGARRCGGYADLWHSERAGTRKTSYSGISSWRGTGIATSYGC